MGEVDLLVDVDAVCDISSVIELIVENRVCIGVVAPVRPASPLPPNVPTGPRNQNKYRDRDGNAPAVDGLDYGGGGGGGGSGGGVVGSASERERDIRDRDRERSERDSHGDRDRGERDRDSHRDRDRDRDRSERDRDRSDRSERDRERERDRSVKEGRRTPSAELEDRSSSRYVFFWLQHGVLFMFNVSFIGNGRVRQDWKTRVHQNGASVLTTTRLIHRNFTY